VNGQVFLFHKELEKEAFQPGVGVPVHQAKVVAGNIVAIIGKLDRLAALRTASLSLPLPALGLPGDKSEGFQLVEEGGGEEGGGWKGGRVEGWKGGGMGREIRHRSIPALL
jgi:hypothetical protein